MSAGLFSLVYGFSHAQTTSWDNHATIGFLIPASCCWRVSGDPVAQPQPAAAAADRDRPQPRRVVLVDRNRQRSDPLLFLFLTYYLQQVRGYTPISTGVAFLPMAASVMISAMIATNKLRPRFGPRPLVVAGMLLGGGGMLYLTRLTLASSYATGILPALIMLGVGFGLVISSSINSATLGVQPTDAGVASATVRPPSRSAGRSAPRCSQPSPPAQ